MERHELEELHYITPIANLASILENGILSNRASKAVPHESVASEAIQQRRARVRVPGGRRLHEYANLYFHARNPMMYRRQSRHETLTVIRVDTTVLDVPETVITDGNAASAYVRFAPAPGGLRLVRGSLTFAEDWTHPNEIEYFQRKSAKCAEVLVPDRVDPELISGAYVSGDVSRAATDALGLMIEVNVNPYLFFR